MNGKHWRWRECHKTCAKEKRPTSSELEKGNIKQTKYEDLKYQNCILCEINSFSKLLECSEQAVVLYWRDIAVPVPVTWGGNRGAVLELTNMLFLPKCAHRVPVFYIYSTCLWCFYRQPTILGITFIIWNVEEGNHSFLVFFIVWTFWQEDPLQELTVRPKLQYWPSRKSAL